MTGWQLDLLGGFALRSPEGAAVAFSTRKDRLLLAYLALQGGRPQSRAQLSDLLWADRADAQARGSLRQSLVNLRGILGDQILQSNRETVDGRRFIASNRRSAVPPASQGRGCRCGVSLRGRTPAGF